MIITVIIASATILFLIWFAYTLATTQNNAIRRCFELKKLHNAVLFGKEKLDAISNFDLLSLSRPMLTRVGFGGVGPAYFPSFQVLAIVNDEISRRRHEQA